MNATTLRRKYIEYRKALGYDNCRQFDKYFDILANCDVHLSGQTHGDYCNAKRNMERMRCTRN